MSVDQPTPAEAEAALDAASEFIEEQTEDLGLLAGLRGLKVRVGKGWSANMENGEVTVDPRFFLEAGYRPEWCTYATMHELVAHVREVVHEPELTGEVMRFSRRGDEYQTFHNVLADIAGNRELHRRLPAMSKVAGSLYSEHLFPDGESYREEPRHMQLLDAMIRDEMIPGSETEISDEVREVLDRLRNYEGTGKDAIKEATNPARSPRDRFEMMTGLILPAYLELLGKDKQDPNFQKQEGSGGAEGQEGQEGDGQQGDQPQESADGSGKQAGKPEGEPQENGKPSNNADFSEYYQAMNDRQPRPFTDQQKQEIARDVIRQQRKVKTSPEQRARKALEQEAGHSYVEITRYRTELGKYASEIEQMEEFFDQLISKRLITRRQLSRPTPEGAVLDPSLLGQTHAEIQAGAAEPAGLLEYEQVTHEEQLVGGYDLYYVVDASGSMQESNKAQYAARSSVIFLEGFNAFAEKIKEVEDATGVTLDLDVATSVLTFGDSYEVVKPLGNELTEKQRLDVYQAALNAASSNTVDYAALEHILAERKKLVAEGRSADRQAVVTVVTDGISSDPERARRAVESLRGLGAVVLGIGIEDKNPEELYHPHGRTIDRPEQLPGTLVSRLEVVLQNREGGKL